MHVLMGSWDTSFLVQVGEDIRWSMVKRGLGESKKNEVRLWKKFTIYIFRASRMKQAELCSKSRNYPWCGHRICPNMHDRDADADFDETRRNKIPILAICIRLQGLQFFLFQSFLFNISLTPSPIFAARPLRPEEFAETKALGCLACL